MATPVILPRQGQSVESCIIGEWMKRPGDAVKAGEVLFTYETDKASFEEEAKLDGTLLAVFFEAGDDVPVLTTVAVIGSPGEDWSEFDPKNSDTQAQMQKKQEKREVTAKKDEAGPAAVRSVQTAVSVSPRARAAAERLFADPFAAEPTGPHGRIIERDVLELVKGGHRATAAAVDKMIAGRLSQGTGLGGRVTSEDANVSVFEMSPAAAGAPESTEFEDVPLPNIRKVIAKSMHQSISELAQLTHHSSFDATSLLECRKQLKNASEDSDSVNITVTDLIIFAVSRVLLKHRDLNAHFLDSKMRYFKHVHMGVAMDTPRGLLVPTLFNADKKSLKQISTEVKALAKAAQEGNISPDLLTGGTFTISNLGTLGVEFFTPIINPPQTGILGVNCITERVRTKDGQITVYPAMGLSLTYDHRALDGAPASRFLADLRAALENFLALLVE
ncbi:MAG: Dihydrolipoyllysine-residue acetyltransferase component of pyruvate dehydrogenase complex [Firmicutes bacterium ADurb.Bin182]|nr:MAG: Dihydrolipoyllysine-residue acetyltransferase component of pyruvate dehydrogenase complex [Firmicutes bacterium ADurb.Bin182]